MMYKEMIIDVGSQTHIKHQYALGQETEHLTAKPGVHICTAGFNTFLQT